jgi:hypothetical protein
MADLTGAVTFLFGMKGISAEDFLARTSDPNVIAEVRAQLALPEDQRHRHITGKIERVSPGQNLGWSWQHEESRWALSDASIELCDARPSYVEAHLDEWLRDVGLFCPWSCYVKQDVPQMRSSGID